MQAHQGLRLHQKGVHTGVPALFLIAGQGIGGQGHDGQACAPTLRQLAYARCRLKAIHHRHLAIHQHQIKVKNLHPRERLRTVAHPLHVKAHFFQHGLGHQLVGWVILDQQHLANQACQGFDRGCKRCITAARQARCRRALHRGQAQIDRETGAQAWPARDRDRPPHQVEQALTNGQTQARATKLACGGAVSLRKKAEYLAQGLGRNAHARVLHDHANADLVRVGPLANDAEHDFTARRELDGVAQQVDQDLAQAQRVTAQNESAILGRQANLEGETFGLGRLPKHQQRALHQIAQIEVNGFKLEVA